MDLQMQIESDADFVEAQAALVPFVGEKEATSLRWLTRMVRRAEGWRIRVMHPEYDYRAPTMAAFEHWFERPWLADSQYAGVVIKEYRLDEGATLLKGPANPEAEIARRRSLIEANGARVEARRLEVLAQEKREREYDERTRALDIEFRTEEWDKLRPAVQGMLLLALAIDDGVDLAAALRSLVKGMNPIGGWKAPRRVWWN